MSTYLDRLKQLDDENYSRHSPDMELTKPPKAPFVSFGSTGTGHIEKIYSESANDEPPKTDCLDTLASDYAELKNLIADLCRIVGHTEEARDRMLGACSNLYPFQVAEQREYFRQQVADASGGNYWTGQTTH
jgi:hypothetical protein